MKLNRFRTVPYKMYLSFTMLIVITTLMVGMTSYMYFTSNFNEEIEKIHADMLEHTSEMMDSNILQKAEKVYVDLAMNPDLSFLFDNPLEGNYAKIIDAQRILSNAIRLYPDLLESVSVYYKGNQIILSSQQGITYLKDSPDKIVVNIDWIRQMEQAKPETLWIGTRNIGQNLGAIIRDSKLFSYIRAYPFTVAAKRSQGYIAVNMKESALHNIIRSNGSTDRGQMLIIDQQGAVISADNNSLGIPASINTATVHRIINSASKMDNLITDAGGVRSLVSYTTFSTTGWKLIKITSVEQFYQKSSAIQRTLIIICLISTVVGLILANLFTRNLYHPLKALMQSLRHTFDPVLQQPVNKTLNEYTLINQAIHSLSVKMTELETTVEENRPVIKHHLVSGLLYRTNSAREDWMEKLEFLQLDMSEPYFCALLIQFDERRFDSLQMENKQIIIYNLIRELESLEIDGLRFLAISSSDTCISVIVNAPSKDDAAIHQANEQLRGYASQHFLLEPVTAAGGWTEEPMDLSNSYKEAQRYMKFSYFHPELSWLPDAVFWDKGLYTGVFPVQFSDRFEDALKNRDEQAAIKVIHEIVKELQSGMYPVEQCHNQWRSFVAVYHSFVKGAHLKSENILSEDWVRRFDEIGNIVEFQDWLSQVVSLTLAYIQGRSSNRSAEIVERVKIYIVQHLDRDLSLNVVADQVQLNSSYVSQLFKEETGTNFVDYVTKLRLERTAQLIIGTSMTLEQIAEQVGYNSTTYLIKKFKQAFGVTPKTYKYNHSLANVKQN